MARQASLYSTRIWSYLDDNYDYLKKEIRSANPKIDDTAMRARLLAAHALRTASDIPEGELSAHITDGIDDRGIDALFFDRGENKLFVVQSKTVENEGKSPLSETDASALVNGVNEILALTVFEDGNDQINKLKEEIEAAVRSFNCVVHVILISNSNKPIIKKSQNRINRLPLDEGLVNFEYWDRAKTYDTMADAELSKGCNFELEVSNFSAISVPYASYYGNVNGTILAELSEKFRRQLFAKNLRNSLGKTGINAEIIETAAHEPEKFWYFNNGVTIVSDKIDRAPGSAVSKDLIRLRVNSGSIVNGAQTTSSLATLLATDHGREALGEVSVQVRLIELPSDDDQFALDVTKYNNTQNRMGARDFVSLDPFQKELQIEMDRNFAVRYLIRSGTDDLASQNDAITLQEATTSLVCAGDLIQNVVKAKRQISSMWSDIESDPYLTVFDREKVNALAIVKSVDAYRIVDNALDQFRKMENDDIEPELKKRASLVAFHGNLLFIHWILSDFNVYDDLEARQALSSRVESYDLEALFIDYFNEIQDLYPEAYPAPLFKNIDKCTNIVDALEGEY